MIFQKKVRKLYFIEVWRYKMVSEIALSRKVIIKYCLKIING